MKPDVSLQVNYQLDNALNSFIRLSTRPTPRSGYNYNCKVLLMENKKKYEITQDDNHKAHTINYNTLSASANGPFNYDRLGDCIHIADNNDDDIMMKCVLVTKHCQRHYGPRR